MNIITYIINHIFQIATIFLGIISLYLAYLQVKHGKKLAVRPENVVIAHKYIKILKKREAVVDLFSDIVSRAKKDDTLFGNCRLCANYPKDFFIELSKAVSRGVKILFIIQENPDSEPFLQYVMGLKENNARSVQVMKTDFVSIRMLGIKGKEVLVAFPLVDAYVGIHFSDRRVTDYINLAFSQILNSAKEIMLKREN